MKITFLGTGGANYYPDPWCSCDNCCYAREKGGRNIRGNSSIHFADTCLIDLPPDIINKAFQYGIDLIPANLLLFTHAHDDHFNPKILYWRYVPPKPDFMNDEEASRAGEIKNHKDLPILHIYGTRRVYKKLDPIFLDLEMAEYALDFTIPHPYQECHQGDVDFIPLIASHQDLDEVPWELTAERGLIYLIHAQGKTFLYATDSGTYIDRTRDCIRGHKVDAVIMENGGGYGSGGSMHMDFEKIGRELDFFRENNIFTGEPRLILTHIGVHGNPPHDVLTEKLKGTCMEPAYDGMVVEL
jgi:phosphoribosyl 1,2-cyclic phosphate phosphodiesterase